jgi:hypothetical protein
MSAKSPRQTIQEKKKEILYLLKEKKVPSSSAGEFWSSLLVRDFLFLPNFRNM